MTEHLAIHFTIRFEWIELALELIAGLNDFG